MNSRADYETYLRSPMWRELRRKTMRRDKNKCRACGDPAQQVHHSRYPKILGHEKLPWLYAVCIPCHERIHEMAKAEGLEKATRTIIKSARKQQHGKSKAAKKAKSSFKPGEDWREYAAELARKSRERRRAA